MSGAKDLIMKQIGLSVLKVEKGKYRTLGHFACDIVNAAGLSDKDLADECHLSVGTVRRLREYVEPYNPASSTIEKVCVAFSISMEAN